MDFTKKKNECKIIMMKTAEMRVKHYKNERSGGDVY